MSILNSTFILLLRKKTRFPRLKIVVTSQKQLRTIRTDPLVGISATLVLVHGGFQAYLLGISVMTGNVTSFFDHAMGIILQSLLH